ncbi:MAG TPA: NotI family restriction endonuclease [Armatimonadota bacterium]|nr:NotI family restriction endonuclease [Armatimonadota bacterium]
MPNHPLSEVFGFPVDNFSDEAVRYRQHRLCPYNNRVPNCTKDKAENPLGVCSVFCGEETAITCPIRFRQNWIIADDAASFFFPAESKWTSLTEVKLYDKHGKSAGNIDVVLAAYDDRGRVTDFGALEVQAVYISGNIRRPFEYYMEDQAHRHEMDWTRERNYPRADYLSSSRKRLAPQLIYKGGILHAWKRKVAVALDTGFFSTLPNLQKVEREEAEMAWMVYNLVLDKENNRRVLTLEQIVYTGFEASLSQITDCEPGDMFDFLSAETDFDWDGAPPRTI